MWTVRFLRWLRGNARPRRSLAATLRKVISMSVPATGAQFIAVVRKSNLVPPESLDAFVAQLAQRGEAELRPETLAVRLMDAGLLTRFQAE